MFLAPMLVLAAIAVSGPQEALRPLAENPEPARVDDVVVSATRLREEAQIFVDEIAAPPPGRGLARWEGSLCLGTINLSRQVAQPLIDHIARVAASYGLKEGRPDCKPDVVIFFTEDGASLASALVAVEPTAFRARWTTQLNRDRNALNAFQTSDAAVRWWQTSLPVIGITGERAIRMPGDVGFIYIRREGLVNQGRPIADKLTRAVVIVDIAKTDNIEPSQLADYLAMVVLAQVDPAGDTSRFETILNLFEPTGAEDGFSNWDRAYLASLYGAYSERIDLYEQASSMAREIRRTATANEPESNR